MVRVILAAQAYLLVELNAHSAPGDIPDNASAAMVDFEWHTLVHSRVHLDVHILTNLEVAEVDSKGNDTRLAESPRERVTCALAKTFCATHVEST